MIAVTRAFLLLFTVSACSKSHRGNQSHWITYTSKEYRFTVETPREPQVEAQDLPTTTGLLDSTKTLVFHEPFWRGTQLPDGAIDVWVTPMPFAMGPKTNPEHIFDDAVGSALRVIAGRVSHQKSVAINGIPGREVEATGTVNAAILRQLGPAYFRNQPPWCLAPFPPAPFPPRS